MKTITITFNNNAVTLTPNANGLYKLNDLFRVSGAGQSKRPSNWQPVSNHRSNSSGAFEIVNGGNDRGTYTTELNCYKYAAWISPEFEQCVFECFKAVVNNDLEVAQAIADGCVSIRESCRKNHKALCTKILVNSDTLELRNSHCQSTIMNLACKATVGINATVFKRENGLAPREYWLEYNDYVNLMNYERNLIKIETLLDFGLTYEKIAETLGVETTKSKKAKRK